MVPGVLVLAVAEPAPSRCASRKYSRTLLRLASALGQQSGTLGAAHFVGLQNAFLKIQNRLEHSPCDGMAMETREMVGGRHQPGQEVVGFV